MSGRREVVLVLGASRESFVQIDRHDSLLHLISYRGDLLRDIAFLKPTMVWILEGPLAPDACLQLAMRVRCRLYLTLIFGRSVFLKPGTIPGVETVDYTRIAGYPNMAKLPARELEILRLVYAGAVDKEIAAELSIPLSTVKYGLRRLYSSFGVRGRCDLVRRVGELQLQPPLAHRLLLSSLGP